ncbi:glycosyltransferase [Streptacidiphilus sp. P02-A3a]|uniref:glycosyltransferase n=1 Tax=Streptacidiphilus sp. P02-A3a TaxID=2704468 RepID=UPI0015FE0F18|nr:glycosyltransferase [Streptacidiphilus sp. P02-A3a]QMU69783.1 glycosyltransferase [Streptacidiphilus sp. P02-A3a]
MRIMLVDLWAGGHNARYFDRFAMALSDHEVIAVAPQSVTDQRTVPVAASVSVPLARSAPAYGRPEESWDASIRSEIALIGQVAAEHRPDLIVHLFADHLVPYGAELAAIADTALLVLFPSGHYPDAFGSELTAPEAERGRRLTADIAAFRAAPGAVCVFTLDPVAADALHDTSGAPALWLPEPWIAAAAPTGLPPGDNLLFYGALAHRKGFDRLADALLHKRGHPPLVVAGWVEQHGYQAELAERIEQLGAAGVPVDLRLGRLDEQGCLDLLARSAVTVLPYPRHFGMSRVLLESAHTGTPVVVNSFGLLGHLVRTRGLGVATEVTDPSRLADALTEAAALAGDQDFAQRCARFSADHAQDRFVARLRSGLGL